MAMADEVDPHQVWSLGNAGGGKDGVDGSAYLLDGAIDGGWVSKVNLNPSAEIGRDRRVIHDDDLGSKGTNRFGRCGAHTAGTAHHQRPLAVIAKLLDTSHFCPLLGRRRIARKYFIWNRYLVQLTPGLCIGNTTMP
jgi:hypothetical protein